MDKRITLKSLKMENFKGTKSLEVIFSPGITTISGRNGTGKTTIADAFTWVLFDCDSAGRSDFKAQPLVDGEMVEQIDTQVTLKLTETLPGGRLYDHTFSRALKQKWVKERATKELSYKGNESTYYYNEIPLNLSDYIKKIDAVCDRRLLQLTTSITYFTNLPLKDRRAIIDDMANLSNVDHEILSDSAYELLRNKIAERKTMQEVKAEMSAKIRRIKEDLKVLPARRDEAYRNKPEAVDFAGIRKQIADIDTQIEELNRQIAGNTKVIDNSSQIAEVNRINSEMQEIIASIQGEVRTRRNELQTAKDDKQREARNIQNFINDSQAQIEKNERAVAAGKETLNRLSKEWDALDGQSPDQVPEQCSYCGHVFTAQEVAGKSAQIIKNFNEQREKQYQALGTEAQYQKGIIDSLEQSTTTLRDTIANRLNELQKVQSRIVELENGMASLPSSDAMVAANKEYANLKDRLDRTKATMRSPERNEANEIREKKKEELTLLARNLSMKLALEQQIETADRRIRDLDAQEKTLAGEMAHYEEISCQISDFERRKADVISQRVNSLFQIVTWKLYEPNISNDGEKILCECMVEGVPFGNNLNTGARINAGLDICLALQKHYDVSAPIWIDNMESVTDILVEYESATQQLVALRVSDNILTIE